MVVLPAHQRGLITNRLIHTVAARWLVDDQPRDAACLNANLVTLARKVWDVWVRVHDVRNLALVFCVSVFLSGDDEVLLLTSRDVFARQVFGLATLHDYQSAGLVWVLGLGVLPYLGYEFFGDHLLLGICNRTSHVFVGIF